MPEAVPNEATEKEIRALNVALDDKRLGEVERMINSMPASEIAFFLESLAKEKRNKVWELVDSVHRGEALVHLHDEVRTSLIGRMENQELISATSELELDDLADII
jgi:magnesium transporter